MWRFSVLIYLLNGSPVLSVECVQFRAVSGRLSVPSSYNSQFFSTLFRAIFVHLYLCLRLQVRFYFWWLFGTLRVGAKRSSVSICFAGFSRTVLN